MRRTALLVCVLLAVGAPARFVQAQTQASPPVDGSSGATNAPLSVMIESGPPPITQRPMGPARISGGVLAGNRISFVPPLYPAEAKSAKLSGVVVLHVVIAKDGTVENLKVAASTDPIFNQAAIDAVRQWRYRPYLLNGLPTEVDSTVTINFQLKAPTNSQSPPG